MTKINRFKGLLILITAILTIFVYCSGSGTTGTTGGDGDGDDTTGDTSGTILDTPTAALIADHSSVEVFDDIPDSIIEQISENFDFYYGHTSHGSQIITGLDMVEYENSEYAMPAFFERSDDLGTLGDTSWVSHLRYRLDLGVHNVAMMSWCGGVSGNNTAGINVYLDKMTELEEDYPDVRFIYMTGHLDGTGDEGNLRAMNELIRSYCEANDKILFDFEDIESYDPDGTYYADGSDACEWCVTWCATHDCPTCGSCAHSHCYNCYVKGKAFWVLMARMAGWEEE